VTQERLQELIAGFGSKSVAVVGDFFLDKYLAFDPDLAEVSIETGKVARQVVSVRHSPGAAGAVVANLVALGVGRVAAVGFTGEDGEGYELRNDLCSLGCETNLLFTVHGRYTPTYLKPCNAKLAGLEGETERYDTKNRTPLAEDLQDRLIAAMEDVSSSVDAVIVADQAVEAECGVITTWMRAALSRAARAHPEVVFWADSRGRIALFRDVLLKPNEFEALAAVGYSGQAGDDAVRAAGFSLQKLTCKPVFVTRSVKGMLVVDGERADEVPAVPVLGPTDSTGAGDSATAGAVLALAAGATSVEAALVANLVASVTVQQLGVTGVARPHQLGPQLDAWVGR
jgi:rfaE bifunctional protein kinase chain/domain